MNDYLKSGEIAKTLRVFEGHVARTDFGRGKHGLSIHVWSRGGPMMVTINLVARGDGTHILRAEPAIWVKEAIESLGFELSPKPMQKAGKAKIVEPALSVAGKLRKATKKAAGSTSVANGDLNTNPNMRPIGERIIALREEATLLALYLQESYDEYEEEDEYSESDTETALGLMEAIQEVENPSPFVAALVVDYRPRPDWSDLDQARDIKDELEKIAEVYHASCIKDDDFDATLDELQDWMCGL